ncbi:MAG: DNA polymerase III subunit chi [Kordiimonas sp.]
MTEVRFYHLQGQTLEQALPKLIEKICEAGLKAVVKTSNSEVRDSLDRALWDHSSESFVPHGIEGCKAPELQPIYLTTADDNPANATIYVSIDALDVAAISEYDRCLFMFDGRDENIVSSARASWKAIKEQELEMSYWQQREMGGWEKKA